MFWILLIGGLYLLSKANQAPASASSPGITVSTNAPTFANVNPGQLLGSILSLPGNVIQNLGLPGSSLGAPQPQGTGSAASDASVNQIAGVRAVVFSGGAPPSIDNPALQTVYSGSGVAYTQGSSGGGSGGSGAGAGAGGGGGSTSGGGRGTF